MTTPSAPIQPTPRRPRGRQAPARRVVETMFFVDEGHTFKMAGMPKDGAMTYEQVWRQLQQLPITAYGTLCCGDARYSVPVVIPRQARAC